jgi:sugar lactone lactonase YvrE
MRTLLRGVSLSNGLDWNAEGTRMYYVDTPTRQIAVFDYDVASGDLLNRRVAVEIPASLGYPDGLTVDAEGMLWLALWGGGALTRWDPRTGRLLARHSLPVSQVTSCAFGGANLDILYVTSARDGLTPAQLAAEPLAGAIFALDAGVLGRPGGRFGAELPR